MDTEFFHMYMNIKSLLFIATLKHSGNLQDMFILADTKLKQPFKCMRLF